MKIFVIADTHFGHENIIKYCNRPFKTVNEMDEAMIKNWNETVTNKDVVIHLGDFGLGSKEYISSIVKRLNGKKILIMGNHDNWSEQTYRDIGFHTVSRFPIIFNDIYLLSHAPRVSNGFITVFGHVHDKALDYEQIGKSFCASVENINYKPIELETINQILSGQKIVEQIQALKAKDVMSILNISRPTLCKYVKEGKIKILTNVNGQYRYDMQSVYKLLK